jgi:hypothetical protein
VNRSRRTRRLGRWLAALALTLSVPLSAAGCRIHHNSCNGAPVWVCHDKEAAL